jgi:hypothetical protein
MVDKLRAEFASLVKPSGEQLKGSAQRDRADYGGVQRDGRGSVTARSKGLVEHPLVLRLE